jgi:ferritin-like metal-binding protein YciE
MNRMEPSSLLDLYLLELKDLYDAENRIIKALPKMAEAAKSPDLKNAFDEHLQETCNHAARLERIFNSLNESPKGQKCKGVIGIIDEGEDMIDETDDSPSAVVDAALIASAQRVEHYEIAAYGTVRTWAQRLGRADDMVLLNETLQEEGLSDKKLTALAESYINQDAERQVRV